MASSADIAMLMLVALCKSLVLLVLALAAIFVLRRVVWKTTNVHGEHLVWFSIVLAMLALPGLSLWLPSLPIPITALGELEEADVPHVAQTREKEEVDQSKKVNLTETNAAAASLPQPISLGSMPTQVSLPASSSSPASDSSAMTLSTLRDSPLEAQRLVSAPQETLPGDGVAVSLPGLSEVVVGIWLFGAICLGLRFLSALIAIRTLLKSRKSIELPVGTIPTIPHRTSICSSEAVDSPIVVGWFRHFVLLPVSWKAWSKEKLAAVLAHEFSHINRCDGLTRLLAELNAMIHWFNPVAWIASRQISGLAELACDEAAVVSTGCPTRYARYLLEIAALRHSRSSALAVAMASSETGKRIERLLDASRPFAARSSRLFVAFLLLVNAPVVLAVAMVHPAQMKDEPDAQAELAEHEWFSKSGDKSFLRFQLRVLNPNGSLAKDAVVRARSRDPMKVTNKGD